MKIGWYHLVIIVSGLVASGLLHGRWTNRWNQQDEVHGALLLSQLPRELGDWQTGDFLTINPADIPAMTECQSRRFNSLRDPKSIVVSVTSGRPASVAVHTPDVCYLGSGYTLRGAVSRQSVPLAHGGTASFWVGDFNKLTATGNETIRVRWSWSADGVWQAPNFPRFEFAGPRILYKLYIVHSLSEDEATNKDDPYLKFIAELVPQLNAQMNHDRNTTTSLQVK